MGGSGAHGRFIPPKKGIGQWAHDRFVLPKKRVGAAVCFVLLQKGSSPQSTPSEVALRPSCSVLLFQHVNREQTRNDNQGGARNNTNGAILRPDSRPHPQKRDGTS